MLRYQALLEYDGTAYLGFQRQRDDQPTIQGQLERALAVIAGHGVPITGAGRTDAGVHALGQVVSFELAWGHGIDALQRALNANLPADIVVRKVAKAATAFHPRFDARRRTYHYYVYNHAVRSPLRRAASWHVARLLDRDQMNAAAALLVGVHDFATFGQAPQGDNTIREVFAASWTDRGDDSLRFEITANAFLYRMVRSVVGSLKLVGEGRWSVAAFAAALAARDRSRGGPVAPPQGLFLAAVSYDEQEKWASAG